MPPRRSRRTRTKAPGRLTLAERAAGVLLHPTALPGPYGCGDVGSAARKFVDFLAASGLGWWQMLPINPVGPGNSPYSATSAFAGSPLLVDLDGLVDMGLLTKRDLKPPKLPVSRVDYGRTGAFRLACLRAAHAAFVASGGPRKRGYTSFCDAQREWLDDHALFVALHTRYGEKSWLRWPMALRKRQVKALAKARVEHAEACDFERFVQYVFDRQWTALRKYARERGVGLIGDVPIFVADDSSDVWARQKLFDLEPNGRPRTVSGVPPDLFSKTGQRWGHPQYRWAQHKREGFAWWIARFGRVFAQFDAVRIDHFLGFNRVWAVPGRAKTARKGRWVRTPGRALFTALRNELGTLEIIAEDLGLLVPAAAKLRDDFGFPGMRLLHFAFGDRDEDGRYHQPHRHPVNCVAYPGTHDNDTTVGWFAALKKAGKKRRQKGELRIHERVLRYTGTDGRAIHWDLLRLAFGSPANTAVVPMQDLLGLDNRARMNLPGTESGNWEWRMKRGALTAGLARRVREVAVAYERMREK
jgi:4-alpha-glucanotransferase